MGQLLDPAILPGNRISALHNGDQSFPAILGTIRGNTKGITFETYIYWSGAVGRTFCEALCERAGAGVQVHVMRDRAGSGDTKAKCLDELKAARVEAELYSSLLDAGVKMYKCQPTMHQCKVLIVDDVWVSGGSTRLADRSFRLYDEANLNMCDAPFAGEQLKVFTQDKGRCRLMMRAEFRRRSAVSNRFDSFAGRFCREL